MVGGAAACRALVGIDDLRFTDASVDFDAPQDTSVTDGGGDAHADSTPSDAALACLADAVAAPDVGSWDANARNRDACTPAEVDSLYQACGDPTQCSQDACAPVIGSACAQCITGTGGAVTFEDNVPMPSVGACVSTLVNTTCGRLAYAWHECGRAACRICAPTQSCFHPQDAVYVQCVYQAMNGSGGPCANERASMQTCLDTYDAAALVGSVSGCGLFALDEPSQYPEIAKLMCSQ